MFKQKRTHIKFISLIVLVVTLLLGGFLVNTKTAFAATVTAPSPTIVSYTMSKVIISQNIDGTFNTAIIIGCAPRSGDLYDMNTGKRCTYNTTVAIVGCAVLSGDKYDANTGKLCLNDTSIPSSIDKKDISITNINNEISIKTSPKLETAPIITPQIAQITSILIKTLPVEKTKNIIVVDSITSDQNDVSGTDNTAVTLSGRAQLGNSLTASVQRIGSILQGPMSIWLILLIIIIILGGGYGIFNLISNKKNEEIIKQEPLKAEVKQNTVVSSIQQPTNPQVSSQQQDILKQQTQPIINK